MEKTTTEKTQNYKEEIKLITFQPQQMLDEISKLKDKISSLKLELNTSKMLTIDLKEDIKELRKFSLKRMVCNMLLNLFGGQWEEGKQ